MSSAGSGDPSSVPADPPDRHTDPAQGSVRWRSDGSATGQKRRPRGCLIGLGVAAVVVGGLTLWPSSPRPTWASPSETDAAGGRRRRCRRPGTHGRIRLERVDLVAHGSGTLSSDTAVEISVRHLDTG